MKHKLLCCLMFFAMLVSVAYAQDRRISGRVTSSADGNPLANVSVRGTTASAQTDENGQYSITVSNGTVITFTALGHETASITINASSPNTINVTMTSSAQELDEVVVVGYGAVKKTDFTGSATTVGAASIDKRPISNPLAALQGAGPGVQTTAPSGGPGSSPGITVRGIGSYSAGSGALYVVDGVEFMGGFANINPDDVESITVLKDAATIAVFGSRGANGVVMVTTKKAKANQSSIDVKAQFGTNTNGSPNYDMLGPAEYYEVMWELSKNTMHYGNDVPMDIAAQIAAGKLPRNANGKQEYNGSEYNDVIQTLGGYNVFNVPNNELLDVNGKLNPSARLLYADDLNWLDQASRTGKRNEYGLTFSNSLGRGTDMYASLNYLNEQGWGMRSNMDRYAGRVNINSQLNNWLKAGVNIFANMNKYDNASTGSTSIVNPFYFSRNIGPIYPVHVHDPVTGAYVYDAQGNKIFDIGNLATEYGLSRPKFSGRHAIAENLWNQSNSSRDFIGARAYVDFQIMPWLKANVTLAPEITNSRSVGYENTRVGDGAPSGRYNQEWVRGYGYTLFQTLTLDKTWGDHYVNALIGHENVESINSDIYGMRQGQGFENFYTFTNFSSLNTLSSGLAERAMESVFFRGSYDYKNRYYATASFRRDGDSRLPKVNRWANFWSASLAWRIDQENFFNVDEVNLLKLRASYGRLGNSDIGTYPYQAGYGILNNGLMSGAVMTSLGSPELRWEGQKPLDIGVDFGIFQNRITGTFDYYTRESDGLLFSVSQPYHNGGGTGGSFSIQKNVGNMRNSGIELTLTGAIVRNPEFNWNMTFNLSTVKNELLTLPAEYRDNGIVSGNFKRMEGRSIYDYYTRSFYGVDPENGKVLYKGINEGSYSDTNPDIKVIGTDTLTYDQSLAKLDYVGKSALPKAYGSLFNNFSYKGFDFNFVLMYSTGGYAMDGTYSTYMRTFTQDGSPLHRDVLNAWKKPGDITNVPRLDANTNAAAGAASDRFLTRSDYLSLSSASLSYRLPKSIVSRLSLKNARVFVSGENLWFITKRKGFNTLSSLTGASATGSYNFARTFNFGVNLSL